MYCHYQWPTHTPWLAVVSWDRIGHCFGTKLEYFNYLGIGCSKSMANAIFDTVHTLVYIFNIHNPNVRLHWRVISICIRYGSILRYSWVAYRHAKLNVADKNYFTCSFIVFVISSKTPDYTTPTLFQGETTYGPSSYKDVVLPVEGFPLHR